MPTPMEILKKRVRDMIAGLEDDMPDVWDDDYPVLERELSTLQMVDCWIEYAEEYGDDPR